MTEEAFLRYRMSVIERMPDSPYKQALIIAVETRMAALKRKTELGAVRPGRA